MDSRAIYLRWFDEDIPNSCLSAMIMPPVRQAVAGTITNLEDEAFKLVKAADDSAPVLFVRFCGILDMKDFGSCRINIIV